MSDNDKIKIITNNRKATFEYFILERFEAGISLEGTEVKSLREAKVSIGEAYARVIKDEVWLIGATINEYKYGNINNHVPDRNRKLLLNKREIKKIKEALTEKGLTLIPLKMYFKNSLVKVELGIGRGKKLYDKRESVKQRETDLKLKRIKL
ncbi:MAG: SsrA-binding protein SmpB [Bacteroidetes bacterium]|nr:SsrA-binding protein SmpB [Bacteroidota bacterium]MBX7045218.1 SsrA-binding protein SmpB [Ignavibacteria bacterium]